jgi:hypothetical protein
MTDKYITDLTGVTYSNLLDTTELEMQRAASATQTEKMTLAQLRQYSGLRPPYKSGWWYLTHPGVTLSAGTALTVNRASFIPFFVGAPVTIQALGARVTTISAAGNLQLAVYAADLSTFRPTGTALGSTGNLSTGTAANVSGAPGGGNFTLQPGLYFFGINCDNSTAVMQTVSGASGVWGGICGSGTLNTIWNSAANISAYVHTSLTFGTWGDLTGATWTESNGFGTAAGAFQVA